LQKEEMKWIRATSQAPRNNQEVLVVKKDEYFIATYKAPEVTFYCKNGTKFKTAEDVKWAELIPPPPET
jgi:hypothetical protein